MGSRRSAVRGPQTRKLFIGVSGGETRMWPFIYFGFHFSLLFLTCTSRSVTGFLKKQDFLFRWREPPVFLSPEEERNFSVCKASATKPTSLPSRLVCHVSGPLRTRPAAAPKAQKGGGAWDPAGPGCPLRLLLRPTLLEQGGGLPAGPQDGRSRGRGALAPRAPRRHARGSGPSSKGPPTGVRRTSLTFLLKCVSRVSGG